MTKRFFRKGRSIAGGMALIAVLWVVAALSILVTGFSRVARDEIGVVASLRQEILGQALGDAVIVLALQELSSAPAPLARVLNSQISYQGVTVPVVVMPLNGLIDINTAPLALLARMYEVAGGLSADASQALAQITVETRSRMGAMNRMERFEACEDLLRVPGVDYDLYARLSPLLTVYAKAGGQVNPMAAPLDVLTVLANGNAAVAIRIVQQRAEGAQGIDTTALETAFLSTSSVSRYRISAGVPLADGTRLLVARTVDLGFSPRDGLPWRTLYAERSFEPLSRSVAK